MRGVDSKGPNAGPMSQIVRIRAAIVVNILLLCQCWWHRPTSAGLAQSVEKTHWLAIESMTVAALWNPLLFPCIGWSPAARFGILTLSW